MLIPKEVMLTADGRKTVEENGALQYNNGMRLQHML